jgi:hypothetical protein
MGAGGKGTRMSGDKLARDVAPWAVQIAAAWRLGTGMGAGARLTGSPAPLPAYDAELERARETFADPGSVARLTRAIGLDGGSSHPAARAAMEAFCRGLAAAATAEGPVPDLPDSYARKGFAAMLSSAEADSRRTRSQEAETAAWPHPPAAVPPSRPPRRRPALPGRRGTAGLRQGRTLPAGHGRVAAGTHGPSRHSLAKRSASPGNTRLIRDALERHRLGADAADVRAVRQVASAPRALAVVPVREDQVALP